MQQSFVKTRKICCKICRRCTKDYRGYYTTTKHFPNADNVVPDLVKILPAGTIDNIAKSIKNGDGITKADYVKLKEVAEAAGKNLDEVVGSKSLDNLLETAKKLPPTKGKTTLFEITGNYNDAIKDFENLVPLNVKPITNSKFSGFTGMLSDGRHITIRSGSSDGRITLEIRDVVTKKGIEIRYGVY